jgi:hypothetical protein
LTRSPQTWGSLLHGGFASQSTSNQTQTGFGREQAAGGRGWKAYVTTDEDEPAETVAYCLDAVFARRGAARPRAADREQR